MTSAFVEIFGRRGSAGPRGKYLSRVFGVFSEEIVRIWTRDARAPYEDIGRPTIRGPNDKRGSTLDFALRSRETGRIYVSELKCEIEYQDYRYFVLSSEQQLNHHKKPAFDAFLALAAGQSDFRVTIGRKEAIVDGAILIWGAATPEGRMAVKTSKSFFDVLTIEDIVSDLRSWKNEPYLALIQQRRDWTNEMCDALAGESRAVA